MALSAFAMQMVPFAAFGQSARFDKTTMETDPPYYGQPDTDPHSFPKDDDVVKTKIAPDLEESLSEMADGVRADQAQQVIIQLKPATNLNNLVGEEVSQSEKERMMAVEVQSNKDKTGILVTDLVSMGGHIKKSFNRVGLVSGELPLSRIRELIEKDEVAYISPDRATASTGHVETTTGAIECAFFAWHDYDG